MLGASVDYLAPQFANLFPGGSAGPGPGIGGHVGYRWRLLHFVNVTSTCCFSSVPTTAPNAGPDVMLVGVGLQINAGGWLRLQPEASVAFGPDAIVSVGMTAFFDLGTPR